MTISTVNVVGRMLEVHPRKARKRGRTWFGGWSEGNCPIADVFGVYACGAWKGLKAEDRNTLKKAGIDARNYDGFIKFHDAKVGGNNDQAMTPNREVIASLLLSN